MYHSPQGFTVPPPQAHVVATLAKIGEIEAMKFAYPLVGACVVFGAWSAFAAKPKAVTVDAIPSSWALASKSMVAVSLP